MVLVDMNMPETCYECPLIEELGDCKLKFGIWTYSDKRSENCPLKEYSLKDNLEKLIENGSFEVVNPFNTYEYKRVVRVADLYDLMVDGGDVE